MINCPHCQAENEPAANVCHECGKELVTVPQTEALPPWLQALKPGHLKEGEDSDTVVLAPTATLTAETVPAETEQAPVVAPQPIAASTEGTVNGGTDTLVATQPTPASRPAAEAG
ncbi:MAG TPA: hypothetical protein VIL85_21315, partial [Thermomicrobiales bacterium]